MAKKQSNKTSTKELKPVIQDKKAIAIPNTPKVTIIFKGAKHIVGHEVATILIKNGKAKLA